LDGREENFKEEKKQFKFILKSPDSDPHKGKMLDPTTSADPKQGLCDSSFFFRSMLPKIFYVTEKAWNYYPYTVTEYSVSTGKQHRFRGYYSFKSLPEALYESIHVGGGAVLCCPRKKEKEERKYIDSLKWNR
jgi:hypothetical protein